MGVPDGELKVLADKIRRQPQLAQDMDVSLLVSELSGRWHRYHNMLEASDEVPVAAWIVRRKVEGLVRPPSEEPESEPFDEERRPPWLRESIEILQLCGQDAQRYLGRPVATLMAAPPPPVKDATLWKLAWSYPKVKKKEQPVVRTVARPSRPLGDYVRQLLRRLAGKPRLVLQIELNGEAREQWVAAFLAAVHLWHGRVVQLQQTEPFGFLVVERVEGTELPHES